MSERPRRFARLRAHRSTMLRRMLLLGVALGMVGGIAAQPIANGAHGEIEWLARIALIMPGIIFLTWLLVSNHVRGGAEEDAGPDTEAERAVDRRIERIESMFDTAAVPRAGRAEMTPADSDVRAELLRSIRRDPAAETVTEDAYRMSRRPRFTTIEPHNSH